MSDDDVERQSEALLAFKKRIVAAVLDSVEDVPAEDVSADQRRDLDLMLSVSDCIDYLYALIIDSESNRDKATSVAVLNLALLQIEILTLRLHGNSTGESDFVDRLRSQAEHARSFIERKPASFNDAIVEQVFKEYVEAHGPWQGKPMPLARKLKPEIDRRALAGDGKPLEPDTIARRLKALLAPTQH